MTAGGGSVPVRSERAKWPLRRIHKWMSVAIGMILLLWVVTGLVMIIPLAPPARGPQARIDFATLTITPAQAAQTAGPLRPDKAIDGVVMRRLGDRIVYVVWITDGAPPVLVDAASGEVVAITPELARGLAVEGLPGNPPITRFERFDTRPFGYFGPVPSYRADIDDGNGTRAWVNAATGEVQRNAGSARVKGFISSLHEFMPLNGLPGENRTRRTALWITSIITIAVALTGYWMALPTRRKRRDA